MLANLFKRRRPALASADTPASSPGTADDVPGNALGHQTGNDGTTRRPALTVVSNDEPKNPPSPQFGRDAPAVPSAVSPLPATADGPVYEANVEDFAVWFGEMSSRNPDRFPLDGITATDFYVRYMLFAEHHALEPVSLVAFGRRIKAAGFRMVRPTGGDRVRVYRAGR